MLRGLWRLTWLEIKIFLREPLGLIGAMGVPVLLFVVLGRMVGGQGGGATDRARRMLGTEVPVFAAVMIVVGAVLSLISVIAIYRESGILKRLRATPLRPHTILTAHVLVKLLLASFTLAVMLLTGRVAYPAALDVRPVGFLLALVASTLSLLSIGFVVASLVRTARFAQPVGSLVFYPMLVVSGLFVPVQLLPSWMQAASAFTPMTYAVSLLRGIWTGHPWSAHLADLAALAIVFVACTAVSARVFRWE